MEEQIQHSDEIEIDLKEIFLLLLNKIWVIIGCFVIGAILAAGITKLFITPQYSASSMIYILSKTTSITSVADIQLGAQITADFEILATSRPVLEMVIEEVGLDLEYEELRKKITIVIPESTQILQMSVEDADPKLAKDISNAWSEATAERVATVMNTDKPNIVEKAVVPQKPASPSLVKNTAIGALLGILLAMAFVVAAYLLDDTIKTEEDIKKYLNMNTLSAIPVQGEGADKKRSKSRTHRSVYSKNPSSRNQSSKGSNSVQNGKVK